jgi:hypothetical protein
VIGPTAAPRSVDDALLSEARASEPIARLGFHLFHDPGVDPDSCSVWHLVVALRERPTTTHFDPERIRWWTTVGGRGTKVDLDRSETPPVRDEVAWGPIRISDRFHVGNAFLTFGGVVRGFTPDAATTVLAFDSVAPILRWSGHSQDLDPLATETAVFFARLRLQCFVQPGAEQRIAAASPSVLYAAFVEDLRERYRRAPLLADTDRTGGEWIAREARRLVTSSMSEWDAAEGLLADLGLRRPAMEASRPIAA